MLGWALHENQWRGSYEEQGKREPDIEAIYSTIVRTDEDAGRVWALLDKYDVTYVYVGPTERGRYPQAGLEKFDWLLEPANPSARCRADTSSASPSLRRWYTTPRC